MPITKIDKGTPLYYEIKGKFESKVGKVQDLATEYGISREYLTRYAKAEKWEKGKSKSIYEATKLIEKEKILTQFKKKEEKHADIVISKMAAKEGEKLALLTLQGESFKKQIELEYAEILLLQMQNMKSTLEATKGGKITDTEFEYVDTIRGKTGTVLRKTKTLTMKDHGMDLIKLGQALGSLQTQPTALIQNNNNQTSSQGGDDKPKTIKEPLIVFEPHYADNKD